MTVVQEVTVRRMRAAERGTVLDAVVAAFRTDPQVRWWFPDDETYVRLASRFFGILLDLRLAGGEVWVADDGAAVSMWNPPGGNLLGPAVAGARYAEVIGTLGDPSAERVAAVDEVVGRLLPGDAHWYLGVLATAPARQGEGLASAVLRPVLSAADRAGLPAVLETSTEGNVSFYGKHGFAVHGEVDVPGAPPMWVLLRPPR